MGYVLGKFEPTDEAAQAILDYAVLYAGSAEGIVPYRQWPHGVKGHFIVRTPPPGMLFVENPPISA
jgi:predicted metal-binding protein